MIVIIQASNPLLHGGIAAFLAPCHETRIGSSE